MNLQFPLLSGRDYPFVPKERFGGCPICGKKIENGAAYVHGGAVYEDTTFETEAFFKVGYHSKATDVSGCGQVDVVKHLYGGQFDLNFCSTSCVRAFFSKIVDEVERQVEQNRSEEEPTP
jgi:hypothetical protein